jgi:hypothetical protein
VPPARHPQGPSVRKAVQPNQNISSPHNGICYNLKFMWQVESNFRIKLGSNFYVDTPTLVAFKGEPLFVLKRAEDGYLGIFFEIHDPTGTHIASVKRNKIYYGDKAKYQIDGSMSRYVFSEKASGKVICDIKRHEEAHPAELDVSVHLYTPSGFLFDATPEQTNLPGQNVVRGCTFSKCAVGIAIE